MTWPLLLDMAWRNLWRHPRRTAFRAFTIALGVCLLVLLLGLDDGMQETMPERLAVDRVRDWMPAALVLGLSALGVLHTGLMAVVERRRELGLLAALGMRPLQIAAVMLAESLGLTALGGLPGGAAGWTLHHGVFRAGVERTGFLQAPLAPGRLCAAALCVAAVGLLAGLYPAWRAARTGPHEVTRA